jgi:hypothetical protein
VPFLYPFVGYDGRYYLCSSDWRKEVDLGNVFDDSIVDLFGPKADQVGGRSPICGSCTHEPTNTLALALADDAAVDEVLDRMVYVARTAAVLRTHAPRGPESPTPATRRLIPVRSC